MPAAEHVAPHAPGLIHSLRADGTGLFSWRTGQWSDLTHAQVVGLGTSASAHAALARWQALEGQAFPAMATDRLPDVSPPWVLILDQASLTTPDRQALWALAHAQASGARVMVGADTPDHAPAQEWTHWGVDATGMLTAHELGTWVRGAQAVITHSGQRGFEALLAGVPVFTTGMPFYAGWGLTHDQQQPPDTRGPLTLAALFEAVAIKGSDYADVAHRGHGSLTDMLDALESVHSARARLRRWGPLTAWGMQRWKRPCLQPFLEAGGHPVRWSSHANAQAAPDGALVVWGAQTPPPTATRTIRAEDGFLRSVGLGSDLIPPWSLVLDEQGIYMDATRPSALIDMLSHQVIDDAMLERARELRSLVVTNRLTKYNFAPSPVKWSRPAGRKVTLVIGQVADDAAMQLACAPDGVRDMESLLRAVRQQDPNAYLVYKPHPDVLSGNRKGVVQPQAPCDRVDASSDVVSLIEAADDIHVVSSLAGLDGLLRQKKVHTWGQPFYAGWGLTTDHGSLSQPRHRTLSLDELVSVCMLQYPLYWDWQYGVVSRAESVARYLARHAAEERLPTRAQRSQRLINQFGRWLKNWWQA